MSLLGTAGGFGAEAPPIHQVHAVPPGATRNFLLMVLLVALLVLWGWWRARRVP